MFCSQTPVNNIRIACNVSSHFLYYPVDCLLLSMRGPCSMVPVFANLKAEGGERSDYVVFEAYLA